MSCVACPVGCDQSHAPHDERRVSCALHPTPRTGQSPETEKGAHNHWRVWTGVPPPRSEPTPLPDDLNGTRSG
eukprot:10206528-Alexandrium_andersonii.AAC.1